MNERIVNEKVDLDKRFFFYFLFRSLDNYLDILVANLYLGASIGVLELLEQKNFSAWSSRENRTNQRFWV